MLRYLRSILNNFAGYTLSAMKIPSCTIELGPNSDVLPQYKDAGVDALYNLLIFTNMLQQEGNENKPPQYRKITKVPVVHTDVPYR